MPDGAAANHPTDAVVCEVIGRVSSELIDTAPAPRQPDEGAPPAVLEIDAHFAAGLAGLEAGARIVVLTWLNLARRDVVTVHPRGDETRPLNGVFTTRSPDRPNPIGLHDTVVTWVDGTRIGVSALEAIDGTPILDVKPALEARGVR